MTRFFIIGLSLLLLLTLPAHAQERVVRVGAYPAPPETGAWSYATLGAGVCSSVSENAGTLSITAAGIGIDDGCLVFQTLSDTDVQVYGRIGTITGNASATTKAGPMIANHIGNTAAHCNVRWTVAQGKPTAVYQDDENQTDISGGFGAATNLPAHLGLSFDDSANICKMFEYDTANTPANPATDFVGVPQPQTNFSINMSNSLLAGFYVQSGHVSETATVTITDYDVSNTITLVDSASPPTRDIKYYATWETGAIQAAEGLVDAKYIGALRNDADGLPIISTVDGCGETYAGGEGCEYNWETDSPRETFDIQIVKTATTPNTDEGTGGVAVTPIEGDFMAKHTIYSTKDYGPLNSGLDKPRTKTSIGSARPGAIPLLTDYWMGFSVYIPANYSYSRDNKRVMIMQMDTDGGPTGIALYIYDYQWGSQKGNRWTLAIEVDNNQRTEYYVGSSTVTAEDVGYWTSFVFNLYWDASTDPTNAFLKIWKSEGVPVTGQNGKCRGFPTNPQFDYTGKVGSTHAGAVAVSVKHPRIYKPNWPIETPLQAGPIEMYFDAQYQGPSNLGGITTTFEDVNPCMLSVGSAQY